MKIVIDIPEDAYKLLNNEGVDWLGAEHILNAVANGTPLPKGHGRLIDADELKKHKYHDNDRFENAVAVAQIDWADTIIEAESEE
jgi:hypothetical protein